MAYVGGAAVAPIAQSDAEALWIQAGGAPGAAATAGAVAAAESSLVANNWNTTDPNGGSFGLWQINGTWANYLVAHNLPNWQTDPLQNAQAAVLISNNGSNWNPWGTFTNGAYLKFLPGTVSNAVGKFVVGDQTPGSVASTVYGQNLGTPATAALGAQPVNTSTPAAPGFNAADPLGIGAAFDRAIAAAKNIALEVFVGAAALALLTGGIAWLAASDPTVRGAVKAAAT